jgi:hypothetical protein
MGAAARKGRQHRISAETHPDNYVIASFVLGTEAAIEILRLRAIAAGDPMPASSFDALQTLASQRYRHPVSDGSSVRARADAAFAAGTQAVIEALIEIVGPNDIAKIRTLEALRTNIGKVSRRLASGS